MNFNFILKKSLVKLNFFFSKFLLFKGKLLSKLVNLGDKLIIKLKLNLFFTQFAVFYDKNECIGSAKIISTLKSLHEQNYTGRISKSDKLFVKNYVNNKINYK